MVKELEKINKEIEEIERETKELYNEKDKLQERIDNNYIELTRSEIKKYDLIKKLGEATDYKKREGRNAINN